MKVKKLGTRSTVFTFEQPDWNLNIQLIEADKYNYIIDTGLGSGSVLPVLESINDKAKPIVVINTHYHWDHVWGNWVVGDSIIISHRLCRDIIAKKWDTMIEKNKRYISGEAKLLLPNITFDKEMKFEEDGIRLVFTPGHTVDSISVLDERDRVLNAGDNIGDNMEDIVPSLECREDYIKTLEMYSNMDFDVCISGHNEVLGKDVIDIIRRSL